MISAALFSPAASASRIHRAPTSGQTHKVHELVTAHTSTSSAATHKPASLTSTHKSHSRVATRKPSRVRGQQAIQPERVTEIQQALIHEHYLTGDATGKWDSTTQAAMQKYQADQGWQTKLMPDSRAIKKLGLGPDYSNAINAQNSSFAAPPPISTIPQDQATGFAEAAHVSNQ
jgi:peptidoglycan hydrolase-like protein with peptidoglycan-binding domain